MESRIYKVVGNLGSEDFTAVVIAACEDLVDFHIQDGLGPLDIVGAAEYKKIEQIGTSHLDKHGLIALEWHDLTGA